MPYGSRYIELCQVCRRSHDFVSDTFRQSSSFPITIDSAIIRLKYFQLCRMLKIMSKAVAVGERKNGGYRLEIGSFFNIFNHPKHGGKTGWNFFILVHFLLKEFSMANDRTRMWTRPTSRWTVTTAFFWSKIWRHPCYTLEKATSI